MSEPEKKKDIASLMILDSKKPSVHRMRSLFEGAVKNTQGFATRLDLTPRFADPAAFDGYRNRDTQIMWLGFAIGQRCAQRVFENTIGGEG